MRALRYELRLELEKKVVKRRNIVYHLQSVHYHLRFLNNEEAME